MKFFVPSATSPEESEIVFEAVRTHVSAPIQNRRIYSLSWKHAGQSMNTKIGEYLPPYYQTGFEPVVVILDCGDLYKACTESRGVASGDGVFIRRSSVQTVTYFDSEA